VNRCQSFKHSALSAGGALAVSAYCRDCLIKVALAESLEDRGRLDALLENWTPGAELKLQKGDCARCGRKGEVSYFEVPPNPEKEPPKPEA
jgi:hypothetical protein